MPSKYHRDKLVELSSESFQAGNRTGVGISLSTMKNIRATARKKTQVDKNLFTAISYLQQSIEREDEKMPWKWDIFGESCLVIFNTSI
ncbi:Hypothetical predicted protein [Paramuricea clavata]|uniref:Uncharacterized protein n=1 Tax=Paramuricea clavata TaxID=317549 RepID=A0A6S7FHX3_PARCT|nr:Hypothetical predicted protein [Paramuricea clavata]